MTDDLVHLHLMDRTSACRLQGRSTISPPLTAPDVLLVGGSKSAAMENEEPGHVTFVIEGKDKGETPTLGSCVSACLRGYISPVPPTPTGNAIRKVGLDACGFR